MRIYTARLRMASHPCGRLAVGQGCGGRSFSISMFSLQAVRADGLRRTSKRLAGLIYGSRCRRGGARSHRE